MTDMTDHHPSARSVALDLLDAVLGRKRPLDEAIVDHPGFAGLDGRDRGFVRLLAATVLRRLGQIDALIDAMLERPLPAKAKGARDVLRLGACQLLFLETPAHAAVSTAVDLAQARGHGPHKALVNAVLRRLGREGLALAANQDAARMNTPDWLWENWVTAYGEPVCRRIAEAHLTEAPLDITVNGDPGAWAERLEARVLPTGGLRRPAGGLVEDLPGFGDGAWWVQDAAAGLPARLLGDVAGQRVTELCAAPGGKTAQLASMGAEVTAVDRTEKRLARLKENLDRLGLAAALVAADVDAWRPTEPADAVLLDAPCSATGTIRRHPDVARLKTPDDVAELAAVQDRLLAAALEMVSPGGVLVYCVCSLEPEEGIERIEALLRSGAPVTRVPIGAAEVGGVRELVSATGDLRTLPCHLGAEGGMDGFFAARLERL
ncbi:MAG: RsmB/NOP family class I SAM-dependent RNA methyltransferase [Rhodospirillales bacterium]